MRVKTLGRGWTYTKHGRPVIKSCSSRTLVLVGGLVLPCARCKIVLARFSRCVDVFLPVSPLNNVTWTTPVDVVHRPIRGPGP